MTRAWQDSRIPFCEFLPGQAAALCGGYRPHLLKSAHLAFSADAFSAAGIVKIDAMGILLKNCFKNGFSVLDLDNLVFRKKRYLVIFYIAGHQNSLCKKKERLSAPPKLQSASDQ